MKKYSWKTKLTYRSYIIRHIGLLKLIIERKKHWGRPRLECIGKNKKEKGMPLVGTSEKESRRKRRMEDGCKLIYGMTVYRKNVSFIFDRFFILQTSSEIMSD